MIKKKKLPDLIPLSTVYSVTPLPPLTLFPNAVRRERGALVHKLLGSALLPKSVLRISSRFSIWVRILLPPSGQNKTQKSNNRTVASGGGGGMGWCVGSGGGNG